MKMEFRMICLCLFLAACNGRSSMGPINYYRFFKSDDERIFRSVQSGDVTYKIKLLTPEFFALKESRVPADFDPGSYLRRFNEIKGNVYFIIDIQTNGQDADKDPSQKAKLISYYQNDVASHISLETPAERKVAPSFVNYEDNFGLSPYNRLLVCFEHKLDETINDPIVLNYDDLVSGNPNIKATFTGSDIKALPRLEL